MVVLVAVQCGHREDQDKNDEDYEQAVNDHSCRVFLYNSLLFCDTLFLRYECEHLYKF